MPRQKQLQQQYVVINNTNKPKKRRQSKPRKLRNPFYQRTFDGQPLYPKAVEQWHIPRNPDDRLYNLIEKSIQQNSELAKNAHAKSESMQEKAAAATKKDVQINENIPHKTKGIPDRVTRDRRLTEFYEPPKRSLYSHLNVEDSSDDENTKITSPYGDNEISNKDLMEIRHIAKQHGIKIRGRMPKSDSDRNEQKNKLIQLIRNKRK